MIELPLMNPELFQRVGIKPPKGVLLYGPPGTGKTLLAKAVAATLSTNFLKVVSSAIVDKYIGESARIVREMFAYAKEHEPCIIFMDEIDAIGGRRFSEGTSADREIQRTLMEVCVLWQGCQHAYLELLLYPTNLPSASQSNGRLRYTGEDKAHHGNKSTRHFRSGIASPRAS